MPSTAVTEPDYANSNLNLLACLALYQHRQDRTIGIGWLSERTRGLLWYYNLLQQQQVTNLLQASYLNEIIQNKALKIKTLIAEAQQATDKHTILKQVLELEQEINIAKAMLDDIKEIATKKQ